ncbi:MAG: hydroxymethylpyrimidine/phosphomethylpyrimidine kinase [Bacteroidetes bacterium]|nr:hydroxymethylpyrimidine/phosphomethylpyrimidine kinase [Bacteroidota bacterium]MBU1720449.1 hydroxymethylpyrimidine/phosphomethylpyrimidine kinase [Bacteroidota bacterium]
MNQFSKKYVLSVAGFDPSGGAGILADIKTFEAMNVYGLGVVSAITAQNDDTFQSLRWTPVLVIKEQIRILFDKYPIDYVKMGIIQGLDVLLEIIRFLKSLNSSIRIIWDPLWKATAGFEFHRVITGKQLSGILREVYLITPNIEEAAALFPGRRFTEQFKAPCSILITGYRKDDNSVIDLLHTKEEVLEIDGETFEGLSKHGTGCVLSSAITSGLATGISLQDSCREAKKYVAKFIQSNDSNLGYHQYGK